MGFKTSIQRELDSFYRSVYQQDFNIRSVTKGAFSQARAKLKPEGFKHLARTGLKVFYDQAPVYQWYGYRLLAIDGSRLQLPDHPTVVNEFGQHQLGPGANTPRSMALCSIMYDPVNLVPVDSQLAPYASSERDLLVSHLEYTRKGDLLIMDRGYPAIWLFFLLKAKQVDFCVRMSDYWWVQVDDFNKSELKETTVTFQLPKKDRGHLSDYPHLIDESITVRLVKVKLLTGETEILCTSLLDNERFPAEVFKELYHLRWQAEEAFKMLKARVEIEQFSGKTATAVKQDFYAKMLAITLCAIYAYPIEEKVKAEFTQDQSDRGSDRKHAQKINRTSALDMLHNMLIPSFIHKKFRQALEAFDNIVFKTRELVRPNRTNPRNHKPKRKYYMNYKRL